MPTTAQRFQVIVPCYNPPEGWEQALANRFALLQEALTGVPGETTLIVVIDGATPNTVAANTERLKSLIPDVQIIAYAENRGKGFAMRLGVQAATAAFVLLTDIDFPYTTESMRRVADTLREKGGIVAGNRSTAYYANVPAFRRWLSKGLRWLLRHVLRQPIDDSQCGLKGFDSNGKAIFLETTIDRFLFDLEFLMLANGRVPVTPVPVELRPDIVFTSLGWKILAAESGNFLKLLLRKILRS
ncbi:MAG: glycosyltransferase family 2 protein [Lewinellaceae bacterium]|nr:glycosyltransferase family 2 protein [Lewinellaceae bacterium]